MYVLSRVRPTTNGQRVKIPQTRGEKQGKSAIFLLSQVENTFGEGGGRRGEEMAPSFHLRNCFQVMVETEALLNASPALLFKQGFIRHTKETRNEAENTQPLCPFQTHPTLPLKALSSHPQ